MPRSLKKGPFIDIKLEDKVNKMGKSTKILFATCGIPWIVSLKVCSDVTR